MKAGSTIMRIDLTGLRFGKLAVVSFSHRSGEGKSRSLYWNCVCDCGVSVVIRTHSLTSGHTQSCGCLRLLRTLEAVVKHGMTQTPEHKAWIAMRQRCNNPRDAGYSNYGGRGIAVCSRWDDFAAFLLDMGQRPTPQHSIEREDNNADYSPDNCIWATKKQQCNNQRRSRRITFNGKTQTLAQWSDAVGINYATLSKRIRNNWPIDQLLTVPADPKFKSQ